MHTTQPRRRALLGATLVAILAASLALAASPAPAATPAGDRFVDLVFPASTSTRDLVYGTTEHLGEPFELKLDIHEPVGDTAERRPLMVWFHGGGFQRGDRAGPLELHMADQFARRGYVVASVGYRLASGNIVADIANAFADARVAVAWLRANAATYRIDTERVVASGMSAGAFISLHLGSGDDIVTDPGLLTGPSHVDAVAALAGAADTTLPQAGEPPIIMYHGLDDEVVPYGLAQDYCEAANAATVPCELVTYEATETIPATHVGFLGHVLDINRRTADFLHEELDLASWSPIDFLDVDEGSVFHDDIAWMATTGISTGYPGPRFAPTEVVTRQTMAAFLHRLSTRLGGPDGPAPDPGFADVSPTSIFYDDIAWLAANGITTGRPGPTPGTLVFDPTAPVSRQSMAAFMYRLDELLAGDNPDATDPGYLDVPPSSPFHPAIAWMAAEEITTGFPGPTFRPMQAVTRQSMAGFLHRLDDHVTEP
jgi:acetyl esterase/lipase